MTALRLVLIAALVAGLLPLPAAAGRAPLAVVAFAEWQYRFDVPDYCYSDDAGMDFRAEGWLAPGATFTFTSPKPVCFAHHTKLDLVEWKTKGGWPALAVTHTDYGLHDVPLRVRTFPRRSYYDGVLHTTAEVQWQGCNTDAGYEHSYADPEGHTVLRFGEFTPQHPVVWSVRNDGAEAAYIEVRGGIYEHPSPTPTGGEGSWDGCIRWFG